MRKHHDPDGRYHVQRYTFNRRELRYEVTGIVKARTITIAEQQARNFAKEDGVQPDIIDSTSGDYIA